MWQPEDFLRATDFRFSVDLWNGMITDVCANRKILAGTSNQKFWDVILITAADKEQASLYEDQLQGRRRLGYIPSSAVQYHVVHDPPGPKIGNGGATLAALDFLRSQVHSALASEKQRKLLWRRTGE
jgi:hypothetical protein